MLKLLPMEPKPKFLDSEIYSTGEVINTQTNGLKKLYSFMYLDAEFDTLSPFVLEIGSKKPIIPPEKARRAYYSFYLGGNNKNFNLTMPENFINEEGDKLIVIPHSFQKFPKPYYWLDLYSIKKKDLDVTGKPLISYVLSKRIRKRGEVITGTMIGWHGIEEEIFADFVDGKNEITFSDLMPFTIFTENTFMYRLAGRGNLEINVNENSQVSAGDSLRVVPATDEQGFYEWIDLYKVESGIPEEDRKKVSSYRIFREDKRINATEWKGAERQLLADYLSGEPNIKFENLRAIVTITSRRGGEVALMRLKGRTLSLYFTSKGVEGGEEIILLPQWDQYRHYEWIDIFKTNKETHQPEGEKIGSVRINNGELNQRNWLGLERQLLKDYAQGDVPFDHLMPIKLVSSKTGMVNIWREKNRKVYLILSKSFSAKEGEIVNLSPEKEFESDTTFLLSKGDINLARYKLNRITKQFTCVDNIAFNEGLSLTFDLEKNKFIDKEGKGWLTMRSACKLIRVSHKTVSKLLDGIPSIRYRHQGVDKTMTLYGEDELLEKVNNIHLNRSRSERKKKISPDEALNELKKLLEVEK